MGISHEKSHKKLSVLYISENNNKINELTSYLKDFGFFVNEADYNFNITDALNGNENSFDVVVVDYAKNKTEKLINSIKSDCEIIILLPENNEASNINFDFPCKLIYKPYNLHNIVLIIQTVAQQIRLKKASQLMLNHKSVQFLTEIIVNLTCSLTFADDATIVFSDIEINKTWNTIFINQKLSDKILETKSVYYHQEIDKDDLKFKNLYQFGYRSFIGLPIPGSPKNLGILYVFSTKPNNFDLGEVNIILNIIVNLASPAIINSQRELKMTIHGQYMESLVKISHQLTETNKIDEQLSLAWKFVKHHLEVSTFFIGLLNDQDQIEYPIAFENYQVLSLSSQAKTYKNNCSASQYILSTGNELIWENKFQKQKICEERKITPIVYGDKIECGFYFPLKTDNQVIGLISIQSSSSFAFSQILLDAFRSLGNHLAAAIKNTRSLEREKIRSNEAQTLLNALKVLTETLDLNKIIKQILTQLRLVVPFDCATIQLKTLGRNKEYLEIFDSIGFNTCEILKGKKYPLDSDDTKYAEVILKKEPIIINNISLQSNSMQNDIRSWMGIPLINEDKVIGLIHLDSETPNFYQKHHANLAMGFASQTAIAIEKAKHHEETEQIKNLLLKLEDFSKEIRPEHETQKLYFEVARLSAELVNWPIGALYKNIENLNTQELIVLNNPKFSVENIQEIKELVLKTAETGDYQILYLNENKIKSAIAFPLKTANKIDYVLLIANQTPQEISSIELEILNRMVDQASIALQSAILIDEDNKNFKHLLILQAINNYIGKQKELEKTLHIILTGLTAGYGLRFNRAVLLLLSEDKNHFKGYSAIGYQYKKDALAGWKKSNKNKPNDFDHYLKLLDNDIICETPLGSTIKNKEFSLSNGCLNEFIYKLNQKPYMLVNKASFDHNKDFKDIFLPSENTLIFPIKTKEELIGLFILDNKFTNTPITETDINNIKPFADAAAIAIKNNRLLEQLKTSEARIKRMHLASQKITQVSVLGNLENTLETIRDSAKSVLGCHMFTLYSYDKSSSRFKHVVHFGSLSKSNIRKPRDIPPSSTVNRVLHLKNKNYYISTDSQHDPFFKGNFAIEEKVCSTMAIKLVFHKEPIGVMFLNFREVYSFSDENIESALLFANQAAIAIQNALLLEKEIRHREYLKILNEAGKDITSSFTLDEILDRIVEKAHFITGKEGNQADFCNILLEENGKLIFNASYPKGNLPDDLIIDLNSKDIGITGKVFLEGKKMLVPDVRLIEYYKEFRHTTLSELAIPIMLGDKVLGVLNVESNSLNGFDQNDVEYLEMLAAQASISIDNARTYENLRKSRGMVGSRTALAWMGMSTTAWRHTIDKHAVTIKDKALLLRKELIFKHQIIDKNTLNRVSDLERLAQYILDKPITPPLSKEEGAEPVLINNLIHERLTRLWTKEEYKHNNLQQNFSLSNETMVWASSEWIRRAFDILVDNSVKVLRNQEHKEISVGTYLISDKYVEIIVSDNGPGFSDEILHKAGKEYIEKHTKDNNNAGMGMGLLIAQTIAETYGGEFKVKHSEPGATSVCLQFPIYQRN